MNITVAPRGILQIDDARIIFRNFSGEPSQFNREGDRNFAVVIPDEEVAAQLADDGWNVKIKPPREEDDSPFMFLPVKIKFNDRGPNAYLMTGKRMNRLDEESIRCLDDVDILSVDMDIRPYDGESTYGPFRSAYLQTMYVTQEIDRLGRKYSQE